jgi:hypothetical protein
MFVADRLTLDAPRRTADGYLAVRAKAARTGVYQYTGHEVDPDNKHGLRDQAIVNVLRDDAEVFDKRSVHSFIGKPITNDHPTEAVTASNWKDHAGGVVMGAIRDGDHLAFDLLLTDAKAIAAVDAGKVELSNGYTADLAFGDFAAADGTKCPVKQTSILGNHVALVDRGRAGSSCRIGDAALCDALPSNLFPTINDQEKPVKTMVIDGLTVDMANADTAIATVQTLRDARDAALKDLKDTRDTMVTRDADIVAKDAEIAKLKTDLTAAKPTLQQLRDAGKAFALIEAKAKSAGVTVTDAMDEAAIMKAVVDKAMPGNTYAGDHVRIAFETLTKDAKVEDTKIHPIIAPAVIGDAATTFADAQTKRRNEMANAWRQPAPAAA